MSKTFRAKNGLISSVIRDAGFEALVYTDGQSYSCELGGLFVVIFLNNTAVLSEIFVNH